MDGLRPYPAYRESGVAWLGRVPAHWEVRRNGRLFTQRNETGFADLPILEVSLRTGVRIRELTPTGRKQVIADRGMYKRAGAGDITYNMMRMWQGALGLAPCDGLVSPAYVVARPHADTSAAYYAHLFRTPDYLREIDTYSRGIVADRNRLYWESFKQIGSPWPPLAEQDAIVRYLADADRRIRRYVRAKQRLIALLEEQKRLIVHHAVTRGLDPEMPLKASGVEWLGDVPAHWEFKKLKQLTQFRNGLAFKPSDWKHAGTPIIRIQNLNGSDEFNYTDQSGLPRALLVEHGDLLFAWSGNRGTSFGSFVWDRPFSGYLNQHIFKLYDYDLHPRYFYYLLRAVTRHVEEQTHGIIGLVHVTKPALGAVVVPLPPRSEQAAVAESIDTQLAAVDAAIARTRREFTLMNEYRTRLVADAVTGKLDVRAVTSQLPNEADTPDTTLLDDAESADDDVTEDASDLEPAEA